MRSRQRIAELWVDGFDVGLPEQSFGTVDAFAEPELGSGGDHSSKIDSLCAYWVPVQTGSKGLRKYSKECRTPEPSLIQV